MSSETRTPEAAGRSRGALWAGRVASALVVLFMLFDGIIKFMKPAPVIDAFAQLGYPLSVAGVLATLCLVCAVLYAVPRTSVFGAILLTGYLGGAISTHVRVGDPLFSHVLFPVYLGAFAWAGIYLRDERLRALIPLKR
jgi:hypothetical protein